MVVNVFLWLFFVVFGNMTGHDPSCYRRMDEGRKEIGERENLTDKKTTASRYP
jgi:hypothetical protein